MRSPRRNRKRKSRPHHCHPQETTPLTRQEELKLSLAMAYGLHPHPICEEDTDVVVRWAAGVRAAHAIFMLLMEGALVPEGLKDGQLAFRVNPALPVSTEAAVKQVLSDPSHETFPSPEEVSEQLNEAARLGAEAFGESYEEMKRLVFDWVGHYCAECHKLDDVLSLGLLPMPHADGTVTFRSTDELSLPQRKRLRAGFERIDEICAHGNN